MVLLNLFLKDFVVLRHQNGFNRGKLAVVVVTGIGRGALVLKKLVTR